jgi:hypothetical protein
MGVDIARTSDLTCFWIVEKYGGVRFSRTVLTMQNATFASQEKQFNEFMELPKMRRACVDQTGIGRQFAERGSERYGYRCEGVTFSGPVKEQLAYPVKAALEDKTSGSRMTRTSLLISAVSAKTPQPLAMSASPVTARRKDMPTASGARPSRCTLRPTRTPSRSCRARSPTAPPPPIETAAP